MSYLNEIKQTLKETSSTYLFLLKIMIPISIIIKILDIFGIIQLIGKNLNPAMGIVGLPGEFGLVIATAILVNIYGALIVFFTLSIQYSYSIAEVTILACMILFAHTLPIEARIAQKAGIRLWYTLSLRILGAFIFGLILNLIFSTFNLYQNENSFLWKPENSNQSLFMWILNQFSYYIMIFLIIFSLMIFMKILKNTGSLEKINNFFKPYLERLGMSKNAAILPLIGMTLGLAYGGGIIVKEAKEKLISKKDIFLSFSFMGLSHSLIEDTLLLLTIGASIFAILFGRLIFTLIIMIIIVKLLSRFSNKTFERIFMNI